MRGYLLYTQTDDETVILDISDKLIHGGITKREFAEKLWPVKAQAAMNEQACIIRRMSEYGMKEKEIAAILDISERTINIILDMGGEDEYDYGYSGILTPMSLAMQG